MANKISYQIIFTKSADFDIEKEIIDKIKDDLDYMGLRFERELIKNCLMIVCLKDLSGNKSVMFFEFFFPQFIFSDKDIANTILNQFNEWIKDHEKIGYVFKYNDNYLFEDLAKYYEEIFETEMELRAVISIIFIDTYQDDFYNLLRDFDISTNYKPKNKRTAREELERKCREYLENEFFYLLFPDYQKFSKKKPIKFDDVLSILTGSQDFKELQDKINNRGITKEEYVDFLNSIKEDLDSIEVVRNCVAHNRKPTTDETENYQKSKLAIKTKIQEFKNNL